MAAYEIIRDYFRSLESGKYDDIIKHFSDSSVIVSPVYGEVQAHDFLKGFLKDTTKAKITVLDYFESHSDPEKASVRVYYQWLLRHDKLTSFEGVFVFNLFRDKIAKLEIFYDAESARKLITNNGTHKHFPFFR